MAVRYICDGCGVEQPGTHYAEGVFKPRNWISRRDNRGRWLFACSRTCIKRIEDKEEGVRLGLPTSQVLPPPREHD